MKTARELMAAGGQWVDARWKDYIKMNDGSYWRHVASGNAESEEDLMEMFFS